MVLVLTDLQQLLMSGGITIVVGLLTLLGVIYQSNKNADKQQMQAESERQLLEQKFEDYKEFLHQINKSIKNDIETLSKRVDEHNNYGIKIPVIEKELESVKLRLGKVEEKIDDI